MINDIVITTAATPHLGGVVAQPKPHYNAVQLRQLALRPMFLARLTARYAEELRVHIFGDTRFKRVSRELRIPSEDIEKRTCNILSDNMRREMWFLDYCFFKQTRQACELLRLNADGYMKAVAPALTTEECNLFARSALLTLLCEDSIEAEEYCYRELCRASAPEGFRRRKAIFKPNMQAIASATERLTKIISRDVDAEINDRAKQALDSACLNFKRTITNTEIVEARAYRVCGTCQYYVWEVCAKGHCRISSLAKCNQMRPACKRYKSVSPQINEQQ